MSYESKNFPKLPIQWEQFGRMIYWVLLGWGLLLCLIDLGAALRMLAQGYWLRH